MIHFQNEYRDSLSRLKRKNSDSHVAINKSDTFYRSIEERVADVEEGAHLYFKISFSFVNFSLFEIFWFFIEIF